MLAFYKYLETGTVSKSEMKDLFWLADVGAKAKWKTAPPKEVFKVLVNATSLDDLRRVRMHDRKSEMKSLIHSRIGVRLNRTTPEPTN